MRADFIIESFQPIDDKGILKARFTSQLASGLVIHGMCLFQKPDGARSVDFPKWKHTDAATGSVSWVPHVSIKDPGILRRFRDCVLRAIDQLNGKEDASK